MNAGGQVACGIPVSPTADCPLVEVKENTPPPLVDELIIISPHALEVAEDLVVVLAHVGGVPAVGARVVVGEGGGVALECGVGGAGDGLAHVGDAVDHVPVVIVRDGVARRQARVGLRHGEEAVDLVGDRGGEDGHALVPVDGLGEVVVLVGVVNPLEAHALCAIMLVLCDVGLDGLVGDKVELEGMDRQEDILGIRLFHLSSVSFVKNSDVFMGA